MMDYQPLSPARSEPECYRPLSPARSEPPKLTTPPADAPLLDKLIFVIKFNQLVKTAEYPFIKRVNPLPPKKLRPSQPIANWRSYIHHMMHNEKIEYKRDLAIYTVKIDGIVKILASRSHERHFRSLFNHWARKTSTFKSGVVKDALITGRQYNKNVREIRYKLEKTRDRMAEMMRTRITAEKRKETLADYFSAWRNSCPTPRRVPNKPINVSNDPYHICTRITVREDGIVNVKISAPLARFHEEYTSQCKKIPFSEEYLEAMREFGYPDWFIETKRARLKEKRPDPLISVFEHLEKQPRTKTKVKSALDKLKSRS